MLFSGFCTSWTDSWGAGMFAFEGEVVGDRLRSYNVLTPKYP